MTPWMRKLHKWIGLLIGLQLVLWMCSGLVMSVLDADGVKGGDYRAPRPPSPAWPADALSADQVLSNVSTPVHAITAGWLLDRPVYKLSGDKGVAMVDARQGQPIEISAELAQRLAAATYRGPGRAGLAEWVEPSLETRAHAGWVWRIPFSDADDTTVYLSPQGDLLEHRNRSWRLFDFFWMLHIMDYSGRKDFNNALVVGSAVGGLWLALSGVWLLFTSFRLAEFLPRRWRARQTVSVFARDGTRLRAVPSSAGDTVFEALRRQGLQLPSNCGGGQGCGLCAVRVRGAVPPPTAADRAQLPLAKLNEGYRLACNLPVTSALDIELGGDAELWTRHTAVVERIGTPSPFLRELVLRPDFNPGPAYRPGSYIQVLVPPYTMASGQLQVPEEHRADWAGLKLPQKWHNKAELRRSYSLSTPVEQAQGRLTLLVRLMHGSSRGARAEQAPGRGSAYLYGLKPGDRLSFSGPFGDFAVQPGQREKVFIGGGAGMGPLRAMILSLLRAGASEPIHFWYGARSLRDAPYVEEMLELAARHANFHWQLVLSESSDPVPPGPGVLTGLVHDRTDQVLLRRHAHPAACDFYVCGPPAMLAATRSMLDSLGVPEDRIAFDDFKV